MSKLDRSNDKKGFLTRPMTPRYALITFMCFVQVERFCPGAFYLSITVGGHFEAKYHS